MSQYLDENGVKALWNKIPHSQTFSNGMNTLFSSYNLSNVHQYPKSIFGSRIITGDGSSSVTLLTVNEIKQLFSIILTTLGGEINLGNLCIIANSMLNGSNIYIVGVTCNKDDGIVLKFNSNTYDGGVYQINFCIFY